MRQFYRNSPAFDPEPVIFSEDSQASRPFHILVLIAFCEDGSVCCVPSASATGDFIGFDHHDQAWVIREKLDGNSQLVGNAHLYLSGVAFWEFAASVHSLADNLLTERRARHQSQTDPHETDLLRVNMRLHLMSSDLGIRMLYYAKHYAQNAGSIAEAWADEQFSRVTMSSNNQSGLEQLAEAALEKFGTTLAPSPRGTEMTAIIGLWDLAYLKTKENYELGWVHPALPTVPFGSSNKPHLKRDGTYAPPRTEFHKCVLSHDSDGKRCWKTM